MSFETKIGDDYANIAAVESEGSVEFWTTPIDQVDSQDPGNWTIKIKMADDESTEKVRNGPHTYVWINTNGYSLFTAAQIREVISELTRLAGTLELVHSF